MVSVEEVSPGRVVHAARGGHPCAAPVAVTDVGIDQQIALIAADRAGNTTTVAAKVSLDRTAPTVTLHSPADGSTIQADDYTAPTCDAADVLSGLDGVCAVTIRGLPARGHSPLHGDRSGPQHHCDHGYVLRGHRHVRSDDRRNGGPVAERHRLVPVSCHLHVSCARTRPAAPRAPLR